MEKEIILHKHLNNFEISISELGIRGRIAFEEAMLEAMEEYKNTSIQDFKREINNLSFDAN
jgi:hypothetical protein